MGGLCTNTAAPLPTANKVISGTQIPEWVSAAGRQIYEEAAELAKSPYVPFAGPRIATYGGSKLTEAERQGQALLTDGSSSYQPFVDEAAAVTRGLQPNYQGMSRGDLIGGQVDLGGPTDLSGPSAMNFNLEGAQPYLDIYQRAADPAVRELERQFAQQRDAQAAQASRSGAFGGSRQAVQDATIASEGAARAADLRTQAGQAGLQFASSQFGADQQARLAQGNLDRKLRLDQGNLDRSLRLQQAEADRAARFGAEDVARGQYETQQSAGLAKASQLQSYAPMIQGLQEQQASGMISSGQAQRQLDQMSLDLAYSDFVEQRDKPFAMTNFALGALKGTPYDTRNYSLEQGQQYVQTPSIYGQTISGLGSLAAAYALSQRNRS
jgi:hypothetical protein